VLVLRRKEGQWLEIKHKSGDIMRVRVYNIRANYPGNLDMAFDDDDRNFSIQRPERTAKFVAAEAEAEVEYALDVKGEPSADTVAMSTLQYIQGISPDRIKSRLR
jgi:hypothetical protein